MNAFSLANQFPDTNSMSLHFREVGDLALDLFHRDGRVEDRWLALHPREFTVLCYFAQQPCEPVTRQQLRAKELRS